MALPIDFTPRAELARAKVNLALHVTGKRSDGYHLLDSLVVFPQIGDRLAIEPSQTPQLNIEGPFARDLSGPADDNLVLKAARAFERTADLSLPNYKITLSKRLPVASGIGGGSSDCAATLRLLEDISGTYLEDAKLNALALALGADVPVCLNSHPQMMRGIGEDISPAPEMPECGMVLINPKVTVETPSVFKALTTVNNSPLPHLPERFDTLPALADYLATSRNDLQAAAIETCPQISEVLDLLRSDSRIVFSRMSGSGATCFGLCPKADALLIERNLRDMKPDWWIASGPIS